MHQHHKVCVRNRTWKVATSSTQKTSPVPDPTVCTEWGSCCWLTVRSFVRLSHCLGCSLLGENEIPLHGWRASDHRTSVHKTGCFGKLSYDGCSTHTDPNTIWYQWEDEDRTLNQFDLISYEWAASQITFGVRQVQWMKFNYNYI